MNGLLYCSSKSCCPWEPVRTTWKIMFGLMLTHLLNVLAISKTAITHHIMSDLPFFEKCILIRRVQGRVKFQFPTPLYCIATSGVPIDYAVIVPGLNRSGKQLHTPEMPESSSIINYEGYAIFAIDANTKEQRNQRSQLSSDLCACTQWFLQQAHLAHILGKLHQNCHLE